MLVLVGVDVVLLVILAYLVLRVGHVATDGEADVAEALLVAEVAVEAARLHRAYVSLRIVPVVVAGVPVLQTDGRGQEAALLVDAGALLVEVVDSERQFVAEEDEVDAEVVLRGHLPGDALRGHLPIAYSAVGVGEVLSPVVSGSAAALVALALGERADEGVEVGEARAACGVATYLSVRESDLEHVEPWGLLLDPRLLAHVPCHGPCGEESPAVAVGEVLRAVVAEVIVDEVAVLVVIRSLSGQTLVLARDRVLDVGAQVLGGDLLVLGVLHVGAEVVGVEERAVPMEQQVEELAAPAAVRRRLRHVAGTLQQVEVELSGLRVARAGTVEGGQPVVLDGVLIVGVESEASGEVEALGDEREVLLQGDVGLDVVLPLVVIARLGRRDPRVDVVLVDGAHLDAVDRLDVVGALGGIVAVAVDDGREEGVVAEELPPDLVVADARRVALVEVAADAELQQGGLRHVDVDVHAIVPALVVGVGVIFVLQRVVGLVHTLVLGVGHRDVVAGRLATAAEVEVGAIAHGAVLEQEVLPVDVGVEVGVESLADDVELDGLIEHAEVAGDAGLVEIVGILEAVDELGGDGAGVVGRFHLAVDLHLAGLTVLGGDEDDAVSTLGAVDGRGRGVLQD